MSAEARRSKEVRKQLGAISDVMGAFEARWTRRRLETTHPDLYSRIQKQRDLFDGALMEDETADIAAHGEATVRGWRAAIKAMEAAGEPDDAYLIGMDPRTGAKVAIGVAPQGVERVRQVYGSTVTWLTPDEVATLYAATEGFKAIDAIKRLIPGAEIIDRRPMDPAKRDSGVVASSSRGAAA